MFLGWKKFSGRHDQIMELSSNEVETRNPPVGLQEGVEDMVIQSLRCFRTGQFNPV